MKELNKLLGEIGISKVKLAKYLGVSRQMIYNYLDLDDLNKWPKDKKVLLFNLLGIKLSQSKISFVCNGKKPQYKGFIFKYKKDVENIS